MTKTNGRAINIVRRLSKKTSQQKERISPYANGNGAKAATFPDSVSLPDDKIQRCLATIELSLRRSNREEAIAAIERAFDNEVDSLINLDSYLDQLQLAPKVIDTLNDHNIYTIRDLILCEPGFLYTVRGLRQCQINTLVLAVESYGFRFSDTEDDD